MNPPGNLESLQQIAAVAALKPNSIMPPTILAETYTALGDYAQAIALHRKAAERGSSVSACEMGEVYWYHLGDLDGAIAAYRQALTMPNTTHAGRVWKPRAEKNLARALVFRAIQERLPRLLGGEDRPGSAAEAVEIARACQYKRYYEAMSRFYAIAFALEPKLADDLEAWHRFNAACGAALAADGRGNDAARLDESARARLRRQALGWLRDDLAGWTRREAGGQVSDRSKMRDHLALWHRDGDLASVRDADALAKLPSEERQAWAKLWADVESLEKKVAEGPKSE
jgi:tetratricopeptide (TPR) repeat protein